MKVEIQILSKSLMNDGVPMKMVLTKEDKVDFYREDMYQVISECSRVLRPSCFCTIVVGTNNNQLSKALKIPPDKVPGIHEMIVELGAKNNLELIRAMSRPITGISNTMRKEYILFLRRE